jgi:hypothetical protein
VALMEPRPHVAPQSEMSAHTQRQTAHYQRVVEQVASPTSTLTESPAADGPA